MKPGGPVRWPRAGTTRAGRAWAGHPRRPGSVMVAVLGVSVLVTIIGVSALLVRRSALRTAVLTADAVQARYAAESVMDLALLRIAADPAWRGTYASGAWVTAVLDDGIQTRFKLIDELDGNLADDDMQPVRLVGQATVRDAVRIYSTLLRPLVPANLVTNGDIEAGTTDWTGYDCGLDARTDGPHAGLTCLSVRDRLTAWAGPRHALGGLLENGQGHWAQAWVRMNGGTATVRIALTTVGALSGLRTASSGGTVVGTEWTRVGALLVPTWSGSLLSANLYVFTDADTTSFRLDDALVYLPSTQAVLIPVPDTWRQEVLP